LDAHRTAFSCRPEHRPFHAGGIEYGANILNPLVE
jgi:hypothetical protein